MTPFVGGPFEASGVAHVPGTDGVLFVDDGRDSEVFWMRLSEGSARAGQIVPIKLGMTGDTPSTAGGLGARRLSLFVLPPASLFM